MQEYYCISTEKGLGKGIYKAKKTSRKEVCFQ